MSKVRLLTITTVGLLICNIVLITFLVIGKPHHPSHREGPKKMIVEKLSFDEDQVLAYDKLIKSHQETIAGLDHDLKTLKKELYALLPNDGSDLERNEIIQKISEIQKTIELNHYKHFQDIKALCKGDQLEKFNELSIELTKIFAPPGPPKQ
jgi:hypothetical protein